MSRRELIPTLTPGGPEWLRTMSASKIAAVVGLSPYESRFSLWHRMAGRLAAEPDGDLFRRGHFLEPAIASWFASQHRDLTVAPAGTYLLDGWMSASPDRDLRSTVRQRDTRGRFLPTGQSTVALLECKSATDVDEWGTPGTDQVPAGYRAQVMWQMHVAGQPVVHVAVLGAYLEFAEYVVRYDADEALQLEQAARAFMDSLPGGPAEARPSIDAHAATYAAVRHLHPDIDDVDVEIPSALAARYLAAVTAEHGAKTEKATAASLICDAIGDARRATCAGQNIAIRVAGRSGAAPSLRPSRTMTKEKSAA